jgi:uncharacterized protein (DUF1778 family)
VSETLDFQPKKDAMARKKCARVDFFAFPENKATWNDAARLSGLSLSAWICASLNRAAGEVFIEEQRRSNARTLATAKVR